MTKKSALDKEQPGAYNVEITGKKPFESDYHTHGIYVDYATSPRDAQDKATEKAYRKRYLNKESIINKVVIVFLGLLGLIGIIAALTGH